MSTPGPPSDDQWPTREEDILEPSAAETVVGPPPQQPPPPPDEPGSRIGWGMLVGILLVALAAAAIVGVWLLTRDDDEQAAPTTTAQTTTAAPAQVTVPDVRGKTAAEATSQLDALGLETQQTQVISDEKAGTVVDQSPDAGAEAAKGATVTLGVAKAGSTTTTTNSATTTEATTTEETTTQETTTQETTTQETTTQATTTTAAPATASVPDVVGSELAPAVRELSDSGLLASVQYIPGEEPLGTVRTQSPQAGQTARRRAHVTVNASSGPGDKEQKTVPDTTGQSLQQAVSTLNAAGLRLIFVKLPITDRTQAGKVVEQTPAAGKTAPENAQVLVYLGAFRNS